MREIAEVIVFESCGLGREKKSFKFRVEGLRDPASEIGKSGVACCQFFLKNYEYGVERMGMSVKLEV